MKPHIRMSLRTKFRIYWIIGNMSRRKAWFHALFRRMLLLGYPVKVRRGVDGIETIDVDERTIEILEYWVAPTDILITRRCV